MEGLINSSGCKTILVAWKELESRYSIRVSSRRGQAASSICEAPYCGIPSDQPSHTLHSAHLMALPLKGPVDVDKDRLGLDKGYLCLSLYLLVLSEKGKESLSGGNLGVKLQNHLVCLSLGGPDSFASGSHGRRHGFVYFCKVQGSK